MSARPHAPETKTAHGARNGATRGTPGESARRRDSWVSGRPRSESKASRTMTSTDKATTDCRSPLDCHNLPFGGITNLDSFRTAPALLVFFLVLLAPSIANGGQVYQLGQVYAEPFPVVVNQSKIVAEAGAYRYAIVDFPPGKHSLRFDVLDDIDPTTYVYFMDEINLTSFLTRRQGRCIATPCGRVSRSHATEFSLSAPLRAYILVDNRKAVMLPARVVLSVLQPGGEQGLLRYWDAKIRRLQSILQIPPIPIVFKHCGVVNAFGGPNGITMCYELYWKIEKTLGDAQLAVSAYRWVLYHELGHALLNRFNFPAYNNEELADEFGAFLAVLLNETESILSSAEYWNRNSSVWDAIQQNYADDRHPLSAQRARNLYSWLLSSNTLLSQWHTQLLKHFQTGYLQAIRANPYQFPWANVTEVDRELRMRLLP